MQQSLNLNIEQNVSYIQIKTKWIKRAKLKPFDKLKKYHLESKFLLLLMVLNKSQIAKTF